MRIKLPVIFVLLLVVVAGCANRNKVSGTDSTTVGDSMDAIPDDANDSVDPADGRLQDLIDVADSTDKDEFDTVTDAYLDDDDGFSVQDATCSVSDVPVAWSPDDVYMATCTDTACVDFGDWSIDFVMVSLSLHSVDWVDSVDDTAPLCLSPSPDYLLVRTLWHDFLADPGYNGPHWGTMPCGGHCHPSTGKVYVVNTATDEVLYLGDQDPSAWPEGIVPETTLKGRPFDVSSDKTYIFAPSTVPLCANGDVFTAENMSSCGQSNWTVCFMTVKTPDTLEHCVHFPIDANPGECPSQATEYMKHFGRCGEWN